MLANGPRGSVRHSDIPVYWTSGWGGISECVLLIWRITRQAMDRKRILRHVPATVF